MKKTMLLICSMVCALFITQSAFAVGLGLYGTGGIGWNKWWESELTSTGTTYNGGGGFVLDTCLAMNRVFNYRLNIGFDYHLNPDVGVNWGRVHIVNTFGFGVVRTKIVRFWLGPQILFGPLFGAQRWGMMAGTGLALGLNINIGKVFTLAFTGAARAEGGYREYTLTKVLNSDIANYVLTRNSAFLLPDRYKFTQGGLAVYGQFDVAIIFRINDNYGR